MNRQELAAYLTDTYGTAGEHLFAKYPSFLVFRGTVGTGSGSPSSWTSPERIWACPARAKHKW